MRLKRTALLISVFAIAAVIILIWFKEWQTTPIQALAVSFVGYTNSPDYRANFKAKVFVISNQWNITVKRWAVVYLESAPFSAASSPRHWKQDVWSDTPDKYLKPGETEQLVIFEPAPAAEWRLRVPWSPGLRAKTALALRSYSSLPVFLRGASEHYACSDSVTNQPALPLVPTVNP